MMSVKNVQQADKRPPSPRQSAKRNATEDVIIASFERLLVRQGVSGLGVNALIKEAGIGKRQLYAYFGGLPGVATEWVRRRGVSPRLDLLRGEDMALFIKREPAQKIRIINRNYAEMLRNDPPMCELLTGEFTRSSEIKEAIDHVRQLVRQEFEQLMAADPDLQRPEIMELNAIAYAASTYIAMRSNAQQHFFGFDLSDDTAWAVVMGMFDRIMDGAMTGQRVAVLA